MNKKNLMQFGRSMVEMLGVLAVVGVLSILGIQGYKKAMLRHRANELMNFAMMVYNQALAKATLAPGNVQVYEDMTNDSSGRYRYRLYMSESDKFAASKADASRNMGLPKPAYMTHPYFNIYVNLIPKCSTSYPGATYDSQSYHTIYFYGMNNSCELCEELKSFTEKTGYAYRRIKGSNKAPLSSGILIYCYSGLDADGVTEKADKTSCYKSTDQY